MKLSLLDLKLKPVREVGEGERGYVGLLLGFFIYNNLLFFLSVGKDLWASYLISWRELPILQGIETIFAVEVYIIEESVRQSHAYVVLY